MESKPVLVALGGNALKESSGQTNGKSSGFHALTRACKHLAGIADEGLVITHGNGPQIGKLAEQFQADDSSLDRLVAETEGMLGYMIEQELGNHLADRDKIATLLTRTEIDPDDEAFDFPSKPIGEWLTETRAQELGSNRNWQFIEHEGKYRRVVPSPQPLRVCQSQVVKILLRNHITVICAGGGGIPVSSTEQNRLHGIEAVIDKDLTSSLLARQLDARLLVMATNVKGVYRDWNDGASDLIEEISAGELRQMSFTAGSMQPKVKAACDFVCETGATAVIGCLSELPDLVAMQAGTRITRSTVNTPRK